MKQATLLTLAFWFTLYSDGIHGRAVGPFESHLECEQARTDMATHYKTSMSCWGR